MTNDDRHSFAGRPHPRWLMPALAFLALCFAPATAPAQISDTVSVRDQVSVMDGDTLPTLKAVKRNPRNALLWAAIPGGGQVYNKRWWKVPMVYGGLLGMIAYADFNQTRYRRFTTALENRCLGDGDVIITPVAECIPTVDEFDLATTPDASLVSARQRADRSRQTAWFGIVAVYLLQGIEAYTDAHLQEFDISDDLSFRLGPVVTPDGSLAAGLTVPLGSGKRRKNEEARVRMLSR